jgi:hypothetical protein
MAFDAENILKGLNNATPAVLVSIDEADAAAIALTPNADGNKVIDISKTGYKGLAAVMVLLGFEAGESDLFINTDKALVTIEASDDLVANWHTIATFPTLYGANQLRLSVTATTGFVQADIGQLMTQETTADTGYLTYFDPALAVIGGVGDIIVQPVDAADVFNEAAGKTVNSAGTGASTKTLGAGNTFAVTSDIPGVYVVRFTSNEKYVRCNCAGVLDAIGTGWIMLTDNAFNTL